MSVAVGIDIGTYRHAAAVCRSGEREADQQAIQISADRAGFVTWPTAWASWPNPCRWWLWSPAAIIGTTWPATCIAPASRWRWSTRSKASTLASADCSAARATRPVRANWQHWACTINHGPDPLGADELHEAARFTMRLVREQAEVCERTQRLIDLGFPS